MTMFLDIARYLGHQVSSKSSTGREETIIGATAPVDEPDDELVASVLRERCEALEQECISGKGKGGGFFRDEVSGLDTLESVASLQASIAWWKLTRPPSCPILPLR